MTATPRPRRRPGTSAARSPRSHGSPAPGVSPARFSTWAAVPGSTPCCAASLGHEALGVDIAPRAIELAKQKAAARGIEASFLVFDALLLADLETQFDTVLDCGLFHGLDDEGRRRYVDGLAASVRPGGRYHMLCFSDRQPGTWGPRRVTAGEIRASFSDGWTVDLIVPTVLDINIDPTGALAWQVAVTRR